MADGPEHYKQAARILDDLVEADPFSSYTQIQAQIALVHAQLATAAAMIAGKADDDWLEALQWTAQDENLMRRKR